MTDQPLPKAKPVIRFSPHMPTPAARTGDTPLLSVIVVAYDMAEQLHRTLHSLSLDYQTGVRPGDYEVVVVENASGRDLGETRATSHRGDFRYFLREETEPTPIHAVNYGASQARATNVAIMIDGARMLTPGAIGWMLAALDLHEKPVVCVPGYHLGAELQQAAAEKGYDEGAEAKLLASIDWPEDGYRLFDISCAAGTSAGGILKPIGESNCIALRKSMFEDLGGFDPGFKQRGGGLVNLDFYKRALETPGTQLVILPGEGSFHQFHGGETTGKAHADRQRLIHDMAMEYIALRGSRFSPPEQRAVYLGPVPDSALRFLRRGAEAVIRLNELPDPKPPTPSLSIVVVAYRMPRQLNRTLYTLSTRYQRNVAAGDYEVIVVENASGDDFDPECLAELGENFRYYRRQESGTSPVHALNYGLSLARGQQVGIMIDGAHMLTPRVVELALTCARAWPNHLVGVPVYHLGPEEQHESTRRGFDESAQEALLQSIRWQDDGYELFRIGVWCGANPYGFMQPMMESNCFFAPRANLRKIEDADPRFTYEGGGALNLHMYRALGLIPGSTYVVLQGEASFHQFHGGVTSNTSREEVMERFSAQLKEVWQGDYRALTREPIYLGSVSPQAQALLTESSRLAERRANRLQAVGKEVWWDQPAESLDDLPFLGSD